MLKLSEFIKIMTQRESVFSGRKHIRIVMLTSSFSVLWDYDPGWSFPLFPAEQFNLPQRPCRLSDSTECWPIFLKPAGDVDSNGYFGRTWTQKGNGKMGTLFIFAKKSPTCGRPAFIFMPSLSAVVVSRGEFCALRLRQPAPSDRYRRERQHPVRLR